VLPVVHHWESAYVPKGIYIARGWERQLDRKLNGLFYEDENGPLTAEAYRHWLDDLSVGFIAVPESAELDYAGEAEARLIASGVPYLEPVFESPDWTVYRVKDPEPLVFGAGDLVKLKPQGFIVEADAPGSMLVRVRWTPYWQIVRGTGCLEESPTGFTRVHVASPGRLRIAVDFSPLRAISQGPRCATAEDVPTGGWEESARWPRSDIRDELGR
jgi:hypothetical protein